MIENKEMKKFAFIGANCSGKTTLLYEILAALKKDGVLCEAVNQSCRLVSFTLQQLLTSRQAQHAIMSKQIAAEVEVGMLPNVEVVLTDSCALFEYAYYYQAFGSNDAMFRYASDWCRSTFTKIYMLDALPFVTGGRIIDEQFRDAFVSRLEHVCRAYSYVVQTYPSNIVHIRRSGILEDIKKELAC